MSQTKVFGMNLGIDPKFIALGLVVIAVLTYYFTSSDSPSGNSNLPAAVTAVKPAVSGSFSSRAAAARRNNAMRSDRGVLKLIPVDGSRGDVDPTLRLALLDRVRNVPQAAGQRNLFDASAPAMMAQNLPAMPTNAPKLAPGPLPGSPQAVNTPPPAPPFNIPLKYYGFVKPTGRSLDGSRGFFMDGENILVGGEGDTLEKRFLIVALTPNMARLEDTQAKQGQELQVMPEATPSQ